MPELPEVEILARHLGPLVKNRTIRDVEIRRPRSVRPTSPKQLADALRGAKFTGLTRRGKYLLFTLRSPHGKEPLLLVGHLGMTGRIYLAPRNKPLPKHTAVVIGLGRHDLVFEDTRYFGRLTLDTGALARLGPEPLGAEFTTEYLASALKRSAQAVKIKLLDQSLVAGVGNIYASEALHRAGIFPGTSASRLRPAQVQSLRKAIRDVLTQAIAGGSTLPLDFAGTGNRDGLFYYGASGSASQSYGERFLVYDREGQPCAKCGSRIRRLVQGARSTFYCPSCQPAVASKGR
jgi:formamidopyrimidine-DNA glycosylase